MSKTYASFIISVVMFICGLLLGAAIQQETEARKWQREAVARGYAEYRLDPATGHTKWEWKTKPVINRKKEK